VKQLGFYSDCYGDAHWSEPHDVIDKDLARDIIMVAKVLLPNHEITEREIELWVEHVGRRWEKPDMLQGAIAFQKAMVDEGLASYSMDEIKAFFGVSGQSH